MDSTLREKFKNIISDTLAVCLVATECVGWIGFRTHLATHSYQSTHFPNLFYGQELVSRLYVSVLYRWHTCMVALTVCMKAFLFPNALDRTHSEHIQNTFSIQFGEIGTSCHYTRFIYRFPEQKLSYNLTVGRKVAFWRLVYVTLLKSIRTSPFKSDTLGGSEKN